MKAGPEMDALVAEKVMGWEVFGDKVPWCWVPASVKTTTGWGVIPTPDCSDNCEYAPEHEAYDHGDCPAKDFYPHGLAWRGTWAPSTDIAPAWEVHTEMCGKPFSVRRRYLDGLTEIARRECEADVAACVAWPDLLMHLTPAVICEAAVKAMETEALAGATTQT